MSHNRYFYPHQLDCWNPEPTKRPSFSHLRRAFDKLAAHDRLRDPWSGTIRGKIEQIVALDAFKSPKGSLVDGRGQDVPEYEPACGEIVEPVPAEDCYILAEEQLDDWRRKAGMARANFMASAMTADGGAPSMREKLLGGSKAPASHS